MTTVTIYFHNNFLYEILLLIGSFFFIIRCLFQRFSFNFVFSFEYYVRK